MSKKKAASLIAGLLVTISGILYKCNDETPLFGAPTAPTAVDAGAQ